MKNKKIYAILSDIRGSGHFMKEKLKCGLLGEKLGHSYSKQIHACLADYEYELYAVSRECAAEMIKGGELDGLNVTIPYKELAYSLCDELCDFAKAAKACGIGNKGLSGKILNPKYGPYMRYCFIITDAPLDFDPEFSDSVCDKCGECIKACPGNAISENGLDTWQCSVYYKGAHKSNPFITDEFLKDNPDRDAILNGEKRFDSVSAREIYKEMNFLPNTQWGYAPCLCGRKCDIACFKHLKGEKSL